MRRCFPLQIPFLRILTSGLAALTLGGGTARAAGEISREDYLQLKREMAELRQEVKMLRARQSPTPAPTSVDRAPAGALAHGFADLSEAVDSLRAGETKAVLTGSAEASFRSERNQSSNFSAVFEPIFLYHINDHLLFEGELELELEGNQTNTKLEYAQIDWSLDDHLTLIGGKFLNPLNTYVERYAPTWIRKLPDNPLGLYDGFLPESNVGLQLRGVYPLGRGHVNFAGYVGNAPRLVTDDPEALGTLDFDNFESQADAKAFGGRIGLQLLPNFEVGYAAQYARVRGDGTPSTSSLLQSVDVSTYLDAAKGRFAVLGQYAWSRTGTVTYDADGALGLGPTTFSNHRDGGYLQLSYRARQWESDFVNRLEFIVRGDLQNAPLGAPGGFDERRITFGLDYWIASATVLKAAYEFDHRGQGQPNGDAILLQISTGF